LTELPKTLAVIGGGPIGCELAQSFARFGSRVSVFDLAPHVLVREDADAAEIVQQALIRDGIDLRLGVNIQNVATQNGETVISFESGGSNQELHFDRLLLAVGRVANVNGIGLEAAGVEFSKQGVDVDDRLRTSNKKIYAVGDVASHPRRRCSGQDRDSEFSFLRTQEGQ
jgi:pyruvate/2-oxoglutarate dehydrogenase complex dihydrolipoamide dehydrogenase (E3) component